MCITSLLFYCFVFRRLRNALLRLPPLTRSDAQLSRITNLQKSASALIFVSGHRFDCFCGLSVCRGRRSRISGLPKRKPSKRLLRPLPICLDIYFVLNILPCDCANRTVGALIRSFPLRQTQNRSDGVPDKTTARRNELRNHQSN